MTEREKVLEILDRVGYIGFKEGCSPLTDYYLSVNKDYILFYPYPHDIRIKISFDENGNITDIE